MIFYDENTDRKQKLTLDIGSRCPRITKEEEVQGIYDNHHDKKPPPPRPLPSYGTDKGF